MHLENEKLLVLAPHPDDETLGCFGLIEEVIKTGGQVYVQVMTVGGYQRSDDQDIDGDDWKGEFSRASEALGLSATDIMIESRDFQSLDRLPISDIIKYIEHESPISLRAVRPTMVAIPTMYSTHQDHVITYKAAITALRTNPIKGRVPPRLLVTYEAPEYNLWSPYVELGNFSPNFFLPMTEDGVRRKCETLEIYQTQLKEGRRGIKSVKIQAEMRGYQSGFDFAEAYSIQRAILHGQANRVDERTA